MLSSSLAVLVATVLNTSLRDDPWKSFWEKKLKSNAPRPHPCFTVPIFRERMQHIIKKELEVIMSIYSWMKLWNFLMILSFFFWLRQTPSRGGRGEASFKKKEREQFNWGRHTMCKGNALSTQLCLWPHIVHLRFWVATRSSHVRAHNLSPVKET